MDYGCSTSLFKNGRHFAAWLGLTPKQYSSGGKTRLAGITKRGDGYIRKLLVQGAIAVIYHINRRHDNYGEWIKKLIQRRPVNIVAIALANKIARISWVILMGEEKFRVTP